MKLCAVLLIASLGIFIGGTQSCPRTYASSDVTEIGGQRLPNDPHPMQLCTIDHKSDRYDAEMTDIGGSQSVPRGISMTNTVDDIGTNSSSISKSALSTVLSHTAQREIGGQKPPREAFRPTQEENIIGGQGNQGAPRGFALYITEKGMIGEQGNVIPIGGCQNPPRNLHQSEYLI